MSDLKLKKSLQEAGIFYVALAAGVSGDFEQCLVLIGEDISQANLTAKVKKNRGVGDDLFSLAAVKDSEDVATWQHLVDGQTLQALPFGVEPDEETTITTIKLTASKATISNAYDEINPQPGCIAYLDWELVAGDPLNKILATGPFHITPGVVG